MFSPGQGALRLTRALGLALAAYALSLTAHVVGGGQAPSLLGTAVLLFITWWACVMVTFRRLGKTALVGVLAVSQLLLHAGLSIAGATGGCMQVMHAHAGHLTNGAMTVCSAASTAPMRMAMHHGGSGLVMTLAHTAAAVVLGLLLARGEAALWFLASLVWPRPLRPLVLPTPMPTWAAVVPNPRAAGDVVAPGGVGRRGPPPPRALAAY